MKWILLTFVFLGTACCAAEADPKAPIRTVLMTKEFPKDTGTEGRMLVVEYPPSGASKPHTHPGAIFAYVLEGAVESAVEKEEPKTFKAGESWYEHPGCVHRVSRNASATEKARVLVFFVTQPGKPVAEPVKE